MKLGSSTWSATAEGSADAERDRLFERLAATLPGMADVARRAGRPIPIVALARKSRS